MDTRTAPVAMKAVAATRQRKARRWLLAAAAIAAIAIAGWLMFSPKPVAMELATVTQGAMRVTVDNQGQVRVHDRYIVAAPVAAELVRVELHDGDPVRKGQVVATLNPLPLDPRQREEAVARLDAARALAREAGLRVRRADSDLQLALAEKARVEKLIASRFVSPQAADKAIAAERSSRAEWDAARSREQAALADVRAAEAALASASAARASGAGRRVELTTPVDGYVLKVNEKSDRIVSAGTPLVTIGDPGKYEIVVDVLSTDAVKVRPGNLVLLEGWGGGMTLRARVRLVEPVAFTKVSALGVEEQRVNIIADPIDDLGPLGDGYRIEAGIVIWSADKVTKAPGSSVFRVGDTWHVFMVEEGRVREREVKIGQRNRDEVEVLSGLNPGDRVVRFPGNQLKDGARVVAESE